MKFSRFVRTSSLAAMAAALTVTALPVQAQSGQFGDRGSRSQMEQSRSAAFDRARQQQRSDQRAARIDQRSEQRAARIDNRSEQRAARVEQRGDRASAQAARQGDRQAARQIDRRSEQAARQIERRGDQVARQVEQRGDWRAQQERNRTYADPNHSRTYRPNPNPDGNRWNDDRRLRNDNRYQDAWRNNDNRWRDNNRQWDRRWRDNNRYDWQRYRNNNRVTFRLGTYYAPYRNYTYRRVGVGGVLQSLFFGQSYWLNDPWQYRLPEAYGPYRWVRYYDDVLLVDLYSGRVVDVIYDFFW